MKNTNLKNMLILKSLMLLSLLIWCGMSYSCLKPDPLFQVKSVLAHGDIIFFDKDFLLTGMTPILLSVAWIFLRGLLHKGILNYQKDMKPVEKFIINCSCLIVFLWLILYYILCLYFLFSDYTLCKQIEHSRYWVINTALCEVKP